MEFDGICCSTRALCGCPARVEDGLLVVVELASACATLAAPLVVLDMAEAELGEAWFRLDTADANSLSLSSEICRRMDCIPEADGMLPWGE